MNAMFCTVKLVSCYANCFMTMAQDSIIYLECEKCKDINRKINLC